VVVIVVIICHWYVVSSLHGHVLIVALCPQCMVVSSLHDHVGVSSSCGRGAVVMSSFSCCVSHVVWQHGCHGAHLSVGDAFLCRWEGGPHHCVIV